MDINSIFLWLTNVLLTFCSPLVYSLYCHHCGDSPDDPCNESKTIRHCPKSMDLCSLQATWSGDLYNEMSIIKSCMNSTLCPNGSAESGESSCLRTHKGLTCTMCCKGDGCNNGEYGEIPRPPPKPPIPQTLVNRLISPCEDIGTNCETTVTWSDYDQRLQVKKQCQKENPSYVDEDLIPYSISEECNVDSDDIFCVDCCAGKHCHSSTTCSKFNMVIVGVALTIGKIFMDWTLRE